jgi:hypothetical protein
VPGIYLSTNFFHARRRGRVKEEYGYRITVYDDDYVLRLRLMFVPLKATAHDFLLARLRHFTTSHKPGLF